MDVKILKELVVKAQNGDNEAIDALYVEFMPQIYAVARMNLQREEDAEDIAQETFLTIIKKINTLNAPEAFISWMKMIVVNKCRNFNKKKKEFLMDDNEDDEPDADSLFNTDTGEYSDILPDKSLDRKATAEIVGKMVSSLNDKHRDVLMMYYYSNMSTAEIAEALSISQGTVKSRLSTARSQIEKAVISLERKGVKLYSNDVLGSLASYIETIGENISLPQSLSYFRQSLSVINSVMIDSAANAVSAGVANTVSTLGSATISNTVAAKVSVAATVVAASVAVGIFTAVNFDGMSGKADEPSDSESSVVSEMTDGSTVSQYSTNSVIDQIVNRESEQSEVSAEQTDVSAAESDTAIEYRDRIHYVRDNPLYYEGNYAYELSDDGTAKLVYKNTDSSAFKKVMDDGTEKVVIEIPEYVNEKYKVKDFENLKMIGAQVVYLPDSITEIPERAFVGCTELEEVHFGKNVKVIKDKAFYACKDITIYTNGSVEDIGTSAFEYCNVKADNLFSDNLKKIGERAFYSSTVDKVTISEKLTEIGEQAFNNSDISEFYLYCSPLSVGSYAFEDLEINHMVIKKEFFDGQVKNNELYGNDGVKVLFLEADYSVRCFGDRMFKMLENSLHTKFSGYTGLGIKIDNNTNDVTKLMSVLSNVYKYSYAASLNYKPSLDPAKIYIIVDDNVKELTGFNYSQCYDVWKNNIHFILSDKSKLEKINKASVDKFNKKLVRFDDSIISGCLINNMKEYNTLNPIIRNYEGYSYIDAISEMEIYDCDTDTIFISDGSEWMIDEMALHDSGISFSSYLVDPKSEQFTVVDGVLFSKDMKTIISYPRGKKHTSYYVIPNTVTNIYKYAFRYAGNIDIIDFGENIADQVITADGALFYPDITIITPTWNVLEFSAGNDKENAKNVCLKFTFDESGYSYLVDSSFSDDPLRIFGITCNIKNVSELSPEIRKKVYAARNISFVDSF